MNDTLYITKPISDTKKPPRRERRSLLSREAEIERIRSRANAAKRWRWPKLPDERYPQGRRAAANRRRIIEAATLLWAEHGIVGETFQIVALKSGVAPATIYNLTGNRDETLAGIVTAHLVRLNERVGAAADATAGAGTAERLEAMLTAYMEGVACDRNPHFLLRHGIACMSPDAREQVRLRYRLLLERVGEPLTQLAPSAEGKLAAALVLAAAGAVGDAPVWFDRTQELEVPVTARRLTMMLLAAVGSVDGPGPRPGCGGPVEACARAWLAGGAG
ncbi:MAG TPA: TetR/AcrR family transcriptional regulator [Acetobacteraceae bacterium]|jgi:AcrR family transcriptional regulator